MKVDTRYRSTAWVGVAALGLLAFASGCACLNRQARTTKTDETTNKTVVSEEMEPASDLGLRPSGPTSGANP